MKRLLTLSALAAALLFAQPVQAQQQDNQAENIYKQMEMMPDSTIQTIMRMMMDNPQMRQMMMGMMMQNMEGDSPMMSGMHGMMMNGDMSGMCMKMCMKNMMKGDMNMKMNMDHMQKNENDEQDGSMMEKSEG